MEAPSISSSHLAELNDKFPYAFYVFSPEKGCHQLWCDERQGSEPYKFMDLAGPEGEYREPGDWVLGHLRRTDPDTGEYQVGTKAGRQKWIQSLYDERVFDKRKRESKERELAEIRNSARFVHGHGRNVSMDPTLAPKSRNLKRKLGG